MADSGNNDGKASGCTGDTMTNSMNSKSIGFIQVNSCLACMWPQTASDETIQYHYCGRMSSNDDRIIPDNIYYGNLIAPNCPLPKEMVYTNGETITSEYITREEFESFKLSFLSEIAEDRKRITMIEEFARELFSVLWVRFRNIRSELDEKIRQYVPYFYSKSENSSMDVFSTEM